MKFFMQIQFAQIKHISSKEAAAVRTNVIYHNTCLLEDCSKKKQRNNAELYYTAIWMAYLKILNIASMIGKMYCLQIFFINVFMAYSCLTLKESYGYESEMEINRCAFLCNITIRVAAAEKSYHVQWHRPLCLIKFRTKYR